MNRSVLAIAAIAATLTLSACGSGGPSTNDISPAKDGPAFSSTNHHPVPKDGVATQKQMDTIDAVARAFADQNYDAASAANYVSLGRGNDPVKNREDMIELREKDSEIYDRAKAGYDKGCYLVADRLGRYDEIRTKMVCDNGDDPNVQISMDKWDTNPYYIRGDNFN